MHTWSRFLIVLLLVPLFIGCKQEAPDLSKKLLKRWDYVSSSSTQVDSTGFLQFYSRNDKNTFTQQHTQDANPLTGTWTLTDSLITLVYDADPILRGIDSSYYEIRNNKPSLVLMEDGKEVSRIEDNQLTSINRVSAYTIQGFNFEQSKQLNLVGVSGEEHFEYHPIVKESQISLTGILRGLFGIFVLLVIGWMASTDRKNIDWKLVFKGLGIQVLFAILILKVPFFATAFEFVSRFFVEVIEFTQEGTNFLVASFVTGKIEIGWINFAIKVLPTIIFFSALTSMFYYWGILQKIVYAFAWVMKKIMRLSGAESLAAAGNIFLGQTETPLLIRPYLGSMTKSEIMTLMTGGMATIAGGVLAAYVGFLGGDDPAEQIFFAKHLLAASVMSAPAALVCAKILVPETESFNNKLEISKERMGSNVLEAIANGTTDGIKLAVNVAGMLLVFIALMAMMNYILHNWIGEPTGLNEAIATNLGQPDGLTFQFVVGYLFAPIAWCLGVASEDMLLVGQLLGEKTILNEFIAYTSLGEMKAAGLFKEEKSVIMATYILCGFANFSSIGIQIGGIGSLIPNRKDLLSKLGIRALIGGTLACLFTAVVVGMLM